MHPVTVKGRLLQFDGEPFVNTPVLFTFTGSFTNAAQYSNSSQTVYTDAGGYFSINLLGNHQGLTDSKYNCKFLNESFNFVLPSGVTEVELSALRQSIETEVPINLGINYQSLSYSGSNTFQLNQAVAEPQKVLLFVNGYKAFLGKDFAIDSSVVTWKSFPLEISDIIEVYY